MRFPDEVPQLRIEGAKTWFLHQHQSGRGRLVDKRVKAITTGDSDSSSESDSDSYIDCGQHPTVNPDPHFTVNKRILPLISLGRGLKSQNHVTLLTAYIQSTVYKC